MGRTLADQFAETLAAAGVKRIYGIVGDSLNGLTDAVRRQGKIAWIHVRHQEVAAFAAGAEAHLTGDLAACAGSCGPGNLHLINGLFDCHRSRVPVLGIAPIEPEEPPGAHAAASDSKNHKLRAWDVAYSLNVGITSLITYWIITHLLAGFVDQADDYLAGMWAVVAVVFVFRDTRDQALRAGIARLIATCVSFALCFAYLLIFPFTAVGLAALLGIGMLVMTASGRRDDIATTGITTTVVMVVAAMSPHDPWQQPVLRFVDTVVGIALGVGGKWIGSYLFSLAERLTLRPTGNRTFLKPRRGP
jgi:hypothetical protein